MEAYVELTGDKKILEDLSETFREDSFSIAKKEDRYILKLKNNFESADTQEVKEKADRIISGINKPIKLVYGTSRLIKTGAVVVIDEEGKIHVVTFADTLRKVIKSVAKVIQTDKNGNVLRRYPHDFIKEVYNLTEKNKNLSDALEIYDPNSLDPREYYKIFEIIRKDVGGEKNFSKIIGFSINEINRFKRSCQHPEAVGLKKSRHAVPKGEPPKKPMSLEEMKRFIKISLEKWILKINEELEKR